MFDDDDDDDEDLFAKPAPKAAPVKAAPAAAQKKAKNLLGDSDEDDDDLFAAKPKAAPKKPDPTPARDTAKKLVQSDDDDDEDFKPKPKAQPPKAQPVVAEKKKLVLDSDSEDDIKPAPAKPAPVRESVKAPVAAVVEQPRKSVKVQSPPKPAENKDENSPPRMSIKELAAKINVAALAPGGANPFTQPRKSVAAPVAATAVENHGALTADGQFDHTVNEKKFTKSKTKKKAKKKKVAFDSDEDDDDFGGIKVDFKLESNLEDMPIQAQS